MQSKRLKSQTLIGPVDNFILFDVYHCHHRYKLRVVQYFAINALCNLAFISFEWHSNNLSVPTENCVLRCYFNGKQNNGDNYPNKTMRKYLAQFSLTHMHHSAVFD